MGSRLLRFLAVVLTALALVPGGAHLSAFPNKIGLPRDAYFVAQGLYSGWVLFGFVLFGALAADLGLAAALRRHRRTPARLALAAGLLIAISLVVFFTWTYPANLATENWTRVPPEWEALRRQWEYSHAVNAGLTFLALCCVVLSVVLDGDATERRSDHWS
jgi:membrane protease YdiL (CAAX protease family)